MKLKKYVKVTAPVSIIFGLALLAVSIYQLVETLSLKDSPLCHNYYSKWMTCAGFGIAIGVLQILASVGMLFAETGITHYKTPVFFIIGGVLFFLTELTLFGVSLGFEIDVRDGKPFCAILGLDLIFLLVAVGVLIYMIMSSKVGRMAGSRAVAAMTS